MRLYAISWPNGDLTLAWASTRSEVDLLVDGRWADMLCEDVEVRPVLRGGIDLGFDKRTGKPSLNDLHFGLDDILQWHRTLRGLPGAPLRVLRGGKGRKQRGELQRKK